MSKEIMDDFDAGLLEGRKHAWDLVGELADFYKNEIVCGDDWPEEEKEAFKKEIQAQVNALQYARHVIKVGSFDEEMEFPW